MTFDALDAELVGGGRASGRGRIALGSGDAVGSWHLDVRDVDARQLFTRLLATRLTGAIDVDLEPAMRTVRGHLADRAIAGGIALEFALAFDERAITLTRVRARAGPGDVALTGRIDRDGGARSPSRQPRRSSTRRASVPIRRASIDADIKADGDAVALVAGRRVGDARARQPARRRGARGDGARQVEAGPRARHGDRSQDRPGDARRERQSRRRG